MKRCEQVKCSFKCLIQFENSYKNYNNINMRSNKGTYPHKRNRMYYNAYHYQQYSAYILYSQMPDVGLRGLDGRNQTNSNRDGRNKSHGLSIIPLVPLIMGKISEF